MDTADCNGHQDGTADMQVSDGFHAAWSCHATYRHVCNLAHAHRMQIQIGNTNIHTRYVWQHINATDT
eukprot:14761-Eustigmatos_ZCMA.PRE.1